MRVLIVENDERLLTVLRDELSALPEIMYVCIAKGRDEGIAALNEECFDLLICDLKIPTTKGELNEDIRHGQAVGAHAGRYASGMPVIILSAFGTKELLSGYLREGRRATLFGTKAEYPMIEHIDKADLPLCIARIEEYALCKGG